MGGSAERKRGEPGEMTHLKLLVVLVNYVLWSNSTGRERSSTVLELDQELAGIYSPYCDESE